MSCLRLNMPALTISIFQQLLDPPTKFNQACYVSKELKVFNFFKKSGGEVETPHKHTHTNKTNQTNNTHPSHHQDGVQEPLASERPHRAGCIMLSFVLGPWGGTPAQQLQVCTRLVQSWSTSYFLPSPWYRREQKLIWWKLGDAEHDWKYYGKDKVVKAIEHKIFSKYERKEEV